MPDDEDSYARFRFAIDHRVRKALEWKPAAAIARRRSKAGIGFKQSRYPLEFDQETSGDS